MVTRRQLLGVEPGYSVTTLSSLWHIRVGPPVHLGWRVFGRVHDAFVDRHFSIHCFTTSLSFRYFFHFGDGSMKSAKRDCSTLIMMSLTVSFFWIPFLSLSSILRLLCLCNGIYADSTRMITWRNGQLSSTNDHRDPSLYPVVQYICVMMPFRCPTVSRYATRRQSQDDPWWAYQAHAQPRCGRMDQSRVALGGRGRIDCVCNHRDTDSSFGMCLEEVGMHDAWGTYWVISWQPIFQSGLVI